MPILALLAGERGLGARHGLCCACHKQQLLQVAGVLRGPRRSAGTLLSAPHAVRRSKEVVCSAGLS